MPVKHHLSLLLVFALLTACSNQLSQESTVTRPSSPSPEVIVFTPTSKFVDIPPSHTPIPTLGTQVFSRDAPTTAWPTSLPQTPTLVDLDKLPKLHEVILSPADVENLDGYSWNPLLLATDTTNELRDSCLWDCAKYGYSLEHGTLTIMLLRAGDPRKAQNTVENLRKDFFKTVGYEYTENDLPTMPPKSWALIDAASSTKDFRTGAAGVAHGRIVILVTYSQLYCEYTPELGRYCEGDTMILAGTSVDFLNAQIRKLETAGYQK